MSSRDGAISAMTTVSNFRRKEAIQRGPDWDTCPHCEGAGAYWDDQTGQPDEPSGGRMITCHVCDGTGLVDTSPCIACGAHVYDHEDDCPVAAGEVR